MKILLVAAATFGGLATSGWAHSPTCDAQAAEKPAACEKAARKSKSSRKSKAYDDRKMTRSEEESLDRAMTRNILQSIEDQLRQQR